MGVSALRAHRTAASPRVPATTTVRRARCGAPIERAPETVRPAGEIPGPIGATARGPPGDAEQDIGRTSHLARTFGTKSPERVDGASASRTT